MRKSFSFLSICFLSCVTFWGVGGFSSSSALAQDLSVFDNDNLLNNANSIINNVNVNELADYIAVNDNMSSQDLILLAEEFDKFMTKSITDSILALPVVYWQYIVPSLYVNPAMPDELLANPKFLPYKGKKPTLIDPDKKAYADKYLDDMHPAFYITLVPKKMPEQYLDGEISEINQDFFEAIKKLPQEFPSSAPLENQKKSKLIENILKTTPFEKYASGEYLNEKIEISRNDDIKADTVLKNGDVLAFLDSIPKVSLIAQKNQALKSNPQKDIKTLMENLFKNQSQISHNTPCQNFVANLDKSLINSFNLTVKEYGFDKDSWAFVCDKSIKAYRLYDVNLNKLYKIVDILLQKDYIASSNEFTPERKKQLLSSITDLDNKYNGNPKDINAVKKVMKNIRETLQQYNMLFYLNTSL